jgi:hypothetical protein
MPVDIGQPKALAMAVKNKKAAKRLIRLTERCPDDAPVSLYSLSGCFNCWVGGALQKNVLAKLILKNHK